ncbi:hypothetical protein NLG97_g666 [Lecanicillium saksenae]|uniref:Uncharacterized protein n=1 Tax=Lecanicillium saksenae TaxID=468837 RepID=A0ACC1R7V4_9HYPO|nr:hypothetical protein NLG97_g666 [Lecanicillium saksenae]
MVKITLAAVAALVTAATANNCTPGFMYCGSSLLKKGAYDNQIRQALRESGQPTDGNHIVNSVFNCQGGPNGDIRYLYICDGHCIDGGDGKDDYCS